MLASDGDLCAYGPQETQLTAEFLRKQLEDPSAIVRDFKAEAAANMAKAGKARRMFTSKQNQFDPIVDAPRLFYLPTDIGTMSCFLPKNQMPSPKRMRIARDEGKRAEEDEEGEDRPEVSRRSTGGQPDGGFAALAKDLEDNEVPHGMELEDAEEIGQGHGGARLSRRSRTTSRCLSRTTSRLARRSRPTRQSKRRTSKPPGSIQL